MHNTYWQCWFAVALHRMLAPNIHDWPGFVVAFVWLNGRSVWPTSDMGCWGVPHHRLRKNRLPFFCCLSLSSYVTRCVFYQEVKFLWKLRTHSISMCYVCWFAGAKLFLCTHFFLDLGAKIQQRSIHLEKMHCIFTKKCLHLWRYLSIYLMKLSLEYYHSMLNFLTNFFISFNSLCHWV